MSLNGLNLIDIDKFIIICEKKMQYHIVFVNKSRQSTKLLNKSNSYRYLVGIFDIISVPQNE